MTPENTIALFGPIMALGAGMVLALALLLLIGSWFGGPKTGGSTALLYLILVAGFVSLISAAQPAGIGAMSTFMPAAWAVVAIVAIAGGVAVAAIIGWVFVRVSDVNARYPRQNIVIHNALPLQDNDQTKRLEQHRGNLPAVRP